MKYHVPMAALAALMLAFPTAHAQEAKAAEAKAAPAAQPAADTPQRRSRANEDARKCLELATNLEIHKCAEQYR